MNKFMIGVIQMDSQSDKQKNLAQAVSFIKEAAEKGARIAVLPESMSYLGNEYIASAEPVPGPTADILSSLARELGIWIHCGSITVLEDPEIPCNMSILFDPEGKIFAKYRKLHMFDVEIADGPSYKESDENIPGEEIVLAKTELGTLGFSVCYDMRFCEIYRLMALNGAQIIFVPSDFTLNTGKDHWEPILRTRAIENACYVVAPAQIGVKPKLQAYGKSMVIDPWGNVIAMAPDRPGVILAEIDLSRVDEIRSQIPALKNRREDIYSLTSDRIRIYE